MEEKNLLILYSGGADSLLMLKLALECRYKPYCLLIDYEQLHKEELKFAKRQIVKHDILHAYSTIKISDMNINSGLTGDGEKNISGDVHEMHVPGRNTIFLSLAFSKAESLGIETIWIGSDWSDRLNLFPDCYPEYIIQMNELFKLAGPKNITVEAPLMGLTKITILNILKSYGINEDQLFSGYGELE